MDLINLEEEILALLEQGECPVSMCCAESNYGSEVRCDDYVMCPTFKTYLVQYSKQQITHIIHNLIKEYI